MEIIRELEASPRGLYCGAIGYFAPDGSAKFNVAIRTLTISGGAGELGIGGAVVQDSTSHGEFDECLLKARYYETARRPMELIETLRWDGGFVRLERHLARMARSAAAFGIPYDRERLVLPQCDAPSRVRIVLDESGTFHAAAAPLGKARRHWTYAISPRRVQSGELLARHKTSWREHLEPEPGADETIFLNERGEIAEGSRSTVFVRRQGVLLTPPLEAGVLDGCLRGALLDDGKCREATLSPDDLAGGEVFLGNSLRGLIPAVPARLLATA
jgi:para-aminobenzoate synthetase/4-amino-4-deoxychorismate lyase